MKTVITDFRISEEEKNALLHLGYHILPCPFNSILHNSVCGHPDMLLHFINKNTVLVHRDMDSNFISLLKKMNLSVLVSKNSLKELYPYNIGLNALHTNSFLIHYLKYSDPILLESIETEKVINVKQGYTKCSCAIVKENAIITSDPSVIKATKKENIDVLYVPPGDILLPGLDYGFIGGTCGLLDSQTIAFYGDLSQYTYGKEIMNFLEKHEIKPIFLRKGKLIDRGSLFTINL